MSSYTRPLKKDEERKGIPFLKITEFTHEYYAIQIAQGYRWKSNCTESEVKNRINDYIEQGLETIAGDVAFNGEGEILTGFKALLVRPRS